MSEQDQSFSVTGARELPVSVLDEVSPEVSALFCAASVLPALELVWPQPKSAKAHKAPAIRAAS